MITKEEIYPLPDLGIEPHIVNKFFPQKMFSELKKQINDTGMGTPKGTYIPLFGRWACGINLSEDIKEYVLGRVREIFKNETLVHAYDYAVMYQLKDNCIPNLWEHFDQNGSQVSVNITIENTADWSLTVEGIEFKQKENDAVIFCGQQHKHGRPPYPTKDENLITTQLFMHYSTTDHWIQDKNSNGVHKYGKDADIRFFNQNRYFPLPDTPISQETTASTNYAPVLELYNEVVGHAYDTETEICELDIKSEQELAAGIFLYKTCKKSSRILKGLVNNALLRQWQQAPVVVDGVKAEINYEIRNCFNYLLTEKQNDCHPQDPIVRVKKSLELGIDGIVEKYRKNYQISPLYSNGTYLLRYEQDNMFNYHYDGGKDFPRVVSVSMFLNDDFTGGEFEFREFGIKIKPEAGDVIVFPSTFPYSHKVNPVEFGVRYSVVKWYQYL